MSSVINKALWARLTGEEDLSAYADAQAAQAALAGLLGTDTAVPEEPVPAVYCGTLNQLVGQAASGTSPRVTLPYPLVTYRADGGAPDGRWQVDVGHVGVLTYTFEVWHQGRSSTLIGEVAEQLALLLDQARGAPLLPLGLYGERCRMLQQSVQTELGGPYAGSEFHAWVGLMQYRFTAQRW